MSKHTLIRASSPLFLAVEWQGQEYITSQLLHRDYLRDAGPGGKYRQHSHFVRLLKSLPDYQRYANHHDIVVWHWQGVKALIQKRDQSLESVGYDKVRALFQAAGYHPLTLINATMQMAVYHNLTDEISRQMAYAANVLAARSQSRPPGAALGGARTQTITTLTAHIEALEQENARLQAGWDADHAHLTSRVATLEAQVKLLDVPRYEWKEPSEWGRHHGLGRKPGETMNEMLRIGGAQMQVNSPQCKWHPTAKGMPYAEKHDLDLIYGIQRHNWKWRSDLIERVMRGENL